MKKEGAALPTCAIINQGNGAWAFEEHARHMARVLWAEISDTPREYNYLLCWEKPSPPSGKLFIPFESIRIASDKRHQAELFLKHKISTPETHLLNSAHEVHALLSSSPSKEWALKYPISCGASGHRLLKSNEPIPADWPTPYIVQKFVRMENPEVYRLYGVAGECFGFNARRFPSGVKPSPWVAHARGARYVHLGESPSDAKEQALAALKSTGLLNSFGCVDLIQQNREWLVLEVGTDGIFNHVDRDFDSPELLQEINRRIAEAFWAQSPHKPWGNAGWRLKDS
jgi:glutathione synthase/RimK-type ligase-like ATP-grasp enzyme